MRHCLKSDTSGTFCMFLADAEDMRNRGMITRVLIQCLWSDVTGCRWVQVPYRFISDCRKVGERLLHRDIRGDVCP